MNFPPHFTKLHQKNFAEGIKEGIEKKRLDPRLADFDLELLAAELDASRDGLFEFMGLQVLYDRYFLRDAKQVLLETPQYFWMRVAMGLSISEADKNAKAIEFLRCSFSHALCALYSDIAALWYSSSTNEFLFPFYYGRRFAPYFQSYW